MPPLEHAQDADDDVFKQRQLVVIKKEEQCEAEQDNEQAEQLHDQWPAIACSKQRARKAQQDDVGLKKAKKLELSAADLQQKSVAWERKKRNMSSGDAVLFSLLNLPKATLTPAMRRELDACGIDGEPAASRYYYMNRGPQLVLRGIVRRVTALFPAAYDAYLDICRDKGISEKGAQLNLECCKGFFVRVLGPKCYTDEAVAYAPSAKDKRPLRELEYVTQLVSLVAGRDITAAQLNECFVPGGKNYDVDYDKLAKLGINASDVILPLGPPAKPEVYDNLASNISGNSAWRSVYGPPGGAPAAAARLGQPAKRRAIAKSSTLKKHREAAAAAASARVRCMGLPQHASARAPRDESTTVTAAATAYNSVHEEDVVVAMEV